ncbi:MAG: rRNA methyltransferase [Cytophagales bacterium]|nr:rRNA methyltransferase [Cytophagales bacterium]
MSEELPADFEQYMQTRLGNVLDDFKQSLRKPALTSIRYNANKLQPLETDCVPWCTMGRYLDERPSFTLDPSFHGGAYYVQEASSMFLEQALRQSLDLSQPLVALDLCAAPGGKSTHILSLLSNESLLISNEVIRSRTSSLLENVEKWGHDNVIVTNNDPSDFGRLKGMFDVVLIDAPCSGEGLFRKEPEAMEQWSLKHVDLCSARQRRIVSDIWPAVKPGGLVVYSTCTYNEKENLDNLTWLSGQEALEFVPLRLDKAWGIETLEQGKSVGYQCYPHRVKGEGFFLSVVRKRGDPTQEKTKTKIRLAHPSTSDMKQLQPWVEGPDAQCFFMHGRTIRMIPMSMQNELLRALQSLHVLAAGTAVAEIIKDKLIPEHGLALSLKRRSGAYPSVPVATEEALDYLRKLPIQAPGARGFSLVEFQGIGLGWINVLPNRVNNLYPSERRIRTK